MRKWHIVDTWLLDGGFALLSMYDDERGRRVVKFTESIEKIEPTMTPSLDVGLRLSTDDAQQIMNELWRAGVRPRDGSGSLAQVEATQAHLEDMRRLVFENKP